MKTKLISEWILDSQSHQKRNLPNDLTTMTFDLISEAVNAFLHSIEDPDNPILEKLHTCHRSLAEELQDERWISLSDDIYLDKRAKGFWKIAQDKTDFGVYDLNSLKSTIETEINTKIGDTLNRWQIPCEKTLLNLTKLVKTRTPFSVTNGRPDGESSYMHLSDNSIVFKYCDEGCFHSLSWGYVLPFLPFEGKEQHLPHLEGVECNSKYCLIQLLNHGFSPKKTDSNYSLLLSLFAFYRKRNKSDMSPKSESKIPAEVISLLHQVITNNVIDSLLHEDTIRADIAPYHRKMIEDTEQGHWSLWHEGHHKKDKKTIVIPNKLVARDPKSSIVEGVVGIDFGTKSTVVVYQNDRATIHPMRIGTGDLSKEIAAFHYENPTVMEFNNIARFRKEYAERENRPFTQWQDLTISHTAFNNMIGSQSSHFNTFFSELKQWAGDKNRKIKIVSKEGTILDLPPFLDLKEGDLNPIEIYAYYLGLYINNLNNGIFLDYILSFPVTYEMAIRDKIIESFNKGLKKSLPPELGKETIETLSVKKGASEPAAYALVALKAFNFDPCDEERVFYGVFDFGGGTTDFDFGIYREAMGPKERRFDYVIEHFGAGGDKYLGGENLLELLAFEIFKKNRVKLLSSSIQFVQHPEMDAFPGSEKLLSSSQEAKINTKTLSEKLRPFWEERVENALKFTSGTLSVNLTDIGGIVHTSFDLDVEEKELKEIISERINRGVTNFFHALRLAFSDSRQPLQDIKKVQIFLAGNSSKSTIVKQLFEQHIAQIDKDMGIEKDSESRFTLHQPLGADKHNIEKPTGKTGVAFGLIESREGGKIKVIDHNISESDIRFKYYLGEDKKGNFKPIIDREAPYHQWIAFIDASCAKFEIFYTEQPSSSSGKIPISDSSIKKKTIKLDITDEDALVYLRVISPTEINYVVAHEHTIIKETYLSPINSIAL